MLSAAATLATESAEHGSSINPYLVGGVTLVILLALVLALISFGAGREHS